MKTKSLFLSALLTLSVVASVVGKDEPRTAGLAVVPIKGSEVFKVIYCSEVQSRIRMNIYNEQSQLIFTETVNGTNGFIRPVNFTGMPHGQYTIELVDASGKRTEKINHQALASSKKNIHISNISAENKRYLVSVAEAGNEVITVRIYDALNNLIHTEKREVKGNFAQVYVVKNSGNVTFEVSDETGNTKTTRF